MVAGVEGGHGEVLTLSGTVVFSRLEFSRPSRVLLKAEFTCVSAVFPQGNSAGVVKKNRGNVNSGATVTTSQHRVHRKKMQVLSG